MNKGLFIYFLGFTLLFFSVPKGKMTPQKKNTDSQLLGQYLRKKMKLATRHIKKGFKQKSHGKLAVSMVFGIKRGLPQNIKSQFKSLSLLHLFTPSGLHFTAFLFFLTPFLNRLQWIGFRQWNLKELIIFMVCLAPFTLGGFFSLKRIACLKLGRSLFPRRISFFQLFLFIFFLDFFWGSYQNSPLSFCFSFIFLGFLLAAKRFSLKLLLYLFTGQILVAFYSGEELPLLGPFLGMGLTSLFTIFFPLLILSLILSPIFGFYISEWIIQFFLFLVRWSHQLAEASPIFKPSLTILIFFAWLMASLSFKIKKASFLAFLSLYSFDLG